MVLASRSKRLRKCASLPKCGASILIATLRPSRVSVARHTSPMPPAPTSAMSSYGPRRIPEMAGVPQAYAGRPCLSRRPAISFLLRDPPIDVRLEHIQRHRTAAEDDVVEGAAIEARA